MAAPRQVLEGTTYLLTRRCIQRLFLLRPSQTVNEILRFCLAVAAARSGVLVHGYGFLSNHYHIVATDPHGRLPDFMHWFNEYVAKCLNAEYGRWESFWAPGSYSAVRLENAEDVLRKLVYALTNPVDAGLVRTGDDWPGLWSRLEDIGCGRQFRSKRPRFFRENGSVPSVESLKLTVPPALSHMTPEEFVKLLRRLVREREEEIRQEFKAKGRKFMGRRRVLAQSPFGSPHDHAPRRGLNPRIACRDKWHRVELLGLLRGFLSAYREAWQRYCRGERDVRFPPGTYWMKLRFGVVCAAEP